MKKKSSKAAKKKENPDAKIDQKQGNLKVFKGLKPQKIPE